MLVLPIKEKWFKMIITGKKKEEYRELKPYYYSRFEKLLSKATKIDEYTGPAFEIVFRNGYTYKSPSVKCLCSVYIGYGKKEWGAKEDRRYYVLYIHKILEIRNVSFDLGKICPKCNRAIIGYPAISRIDNKTEICSECGTEEELQQFAKACRKIEDVKE